MKIADFLDPKSFLTQNPAVIEVQKHNNMIANGKQNRPWMLSGTGRTLWQSAVKLVFINRIRGHDIARGLVESNLNVSPNGSFILKQPFSDPCEELKPFMGYKAVVALFLSLMLRLYGSGLLSNISKDVHHLLHTLEDPLLDDDRLCLYHAAFLSPSGRALLSIRIHSLVRNEINLEGFEWELIKGYIYDLLKQLPYLRQQIDTLHVLFKCLCQHAQKKAAPTQNTASQDSTQNIASQDTIQKPKKPSCLTAAFLIVALHRNAVLHRVQRKKMENLLPPDASVADCYCLREVVQLLHYHMSEFLPVFQCEAMKRGLWSYLEIGALWPQDELFHHMTPKRLRAPPRTYSMVTYPSSINHRGVFPLLGGHYAHPQTYDTHAWALKEREIPPSANEVKKGKY